MARPTMASTGAPASETSGGCERCKARSPVCFRCKGEVWQRCERCNGMGELKTTVACWCASGQKGAGKGASAGPRANCRKCYGTGEAELVRTCRACSGEGMWECRNCQGRGLFACGACGRGQVARVGSARAVATSGDAPEPGAKIRRCDGTEESQVAKLWGDRGCLLRVRAVWAIDNPYLTWRYCERRAELARELGRAPAELRGFHGTHPRNVLAIAEKGFDDSKRAGQAFGSGEYFAKDPSVSVGYSKGGCFMFVCQLCLGHESSTEANLDGDHIWVPDCSYYVISRPQQALPVYIVEFESGTRPYDGVESQEHLKAELAEPVLGLGASRDTRFIDLCLDGSNDKIPAFPAAWWNGDLAPFSGELYYDEENPHGSGRFSGLAAGKVVVVRRGGGKFAAKAEEARRAGARALLVVQRKGAGPLVPMSGAATPDGSFAAAMIDEAAGARLLGLCGSPSGARIASASRRAPEKEVPANRPCAMSAASTDALWLGYLHAHFADQQLEGDVRRFLERHVAQVGRPEVRIVRGKFTQAKVKLSVELPRKEVQALNSKPFVECGVERSVTVDDAHGSSGQKCPRSIAGYCRGRNLRYVDPCWCQHGPLPTEGATYTMEDVPLQSAKGDEIVSAFMQSAPFHSGTPRVLAVRSIENRRLQRQHESYRRYLTEKNGAAPRQVELYHGTSVKILDTVYRHGLFPPSDTDASEECPVSGGKGLRTSLCDNGCKFCTRRHAWDRCHMFGLGVYLGDLAQKSHRYVSGVDRDAGGVHRMVVCSVLFGDALKLEGHLTTSQAMHDVFSLRALGPDDMPRMVTALGEEGGRMPVEQKDILLVKGLRGCCRPGFSVFNSEYISFHPYQCLPLYEIAYEVQ